MNDRMSTLIDAATPARQGFAVLAINFVAWMPDVDELLKWIGLVTAVAVLVVQVQSVRLKSLEIRRVKEDLKHGDAQ